jgi:hypothetical protein
MAAADMSSANVSGGFFRIGAMDIAILVVGAIAASAAVVAVVLQLRQQRQRLDLRFTGAWASSTDSIDFTVRVVNLSQVPIYDVEVFAGPPGLTLTAHYLLGKATLQPATDREYGMSVPRPGAVDLAAGASTPAFSTPWLVVARHGERLLVIEHPVGQFSSDAALRTGKPKLTR